MSRVHIGLGSNLGDRLGNIAGALACIVELPDTELVGLSKAYESEAWPEPTDPRFANAVAILETSLGAPDLLAELRRIEREMGRDQWAPRNSPRGIDLDVLLVEGEEWERPDLIVPHPLMAERDFVITPLLEVDPGARWPDGSPVTRASVRSGRVSAVLGEIPLPDGLEPLDAAGEWVEIKRFVGRATYDANEEGDIAFTTSMLSSAGIPYLIDPPRGNEGAGPYPLQVTNKLLVPAGRADEAREFLAQVKAAPFDFEDAYRMAEENPAEPDLLDEPENG